MLGPSIPTGRADETLGGLGAEFVETTTRFHPFVDPQGGIFRTVVDLPVAERSRAWDRLSESERKLLGRHAPQIIGNLDGIP